MTSSTSTSTTSSSSTSTTSTSLPNQAPVANAGPDRTGAKDVAIIFDGSGSSDPDGTIGIYSWTFGDGGSAPVTTPTVSHTYTATGTYTATLWVRDNGGLWSLTSDTATVTITNGSPTTSTTAVPTTTSTSHPSTTSTTLQNQPPVANAGADQFTQTLVMVNFFGSGTDPDGTIAQGSWSFGDGATAQGLNVGHSYASAGTYTATLTVIDDDGTPDTDTAVVTVSNRPPIANAGPDSGGAPNTPVNLNGTASSDPDGTIVGWAWAFGDGTTGSGSAPAHNYATAGTYTATLTVTDNNGAVASDAAAVTVSTSSPTWARAIGSTASDSAYAVATDGTGNTIVGGAYRGSVTFATGTTKTSAGGSDWFVAKYSPTGTLLWVNSMGGPLDDYLDALTVDASGNVIAAGRFSGTAYFGGPSVTASGTSDMAVAKYRASDGVWQWSNAYGGAYDDAASAVATDNTGNVYFTGYFRGTVNFGGNPLSVPFTTDLDVFLTKLDPGGAHLWSKNFTNDGNERGYGVAVDGTGNVAITGYFSNTVNFGGSDLTSANAMTDIFVARFNTSGTHSWSKRFGAPDGNESGYGAAMDSSGNVLVTGYVLKPVDLGGGTALAALGGTDAFIAKYAATTGNHMWSRRMGGSSNDYGYGVAVQSTSNDVYVTGAFEDVAGFGSVSLTSNGATDAFVAKYSSTGNPSSARQFGGIDSDIARAIDIVAGYPVVAGYFYGSGSYDGTTLASAGVADAFVVRLAP